MPVGVGQTESGGKVAPATDEMAVIKSRQFLAAKSRIVTGQKGLRMGQFAHDIARKFWLGTNREDNILRARYPKVIAALRHWIGHHELDFCLVLCSRLVKNFGCQRSEEHTSELQSRQYLVCRLL